MAQKVQQAPLFAQIQDFLDEYISKIPTYSTIGIALEIIDGMSLKEEKTVSLWRPDKQVRENISYQAVVSVYSAAGFDWSGRAIAISCLRSVVTYLALQALAYVSLCVNGVVGLGKIALGFTISSIEYEKGQEFLEEGLYQLLTAVYDYAIGQFGFICSVFALVEGASPESAQDIHTRVFRAWEGAIKHDKDRPGAEDAAAGENSCLIQRLADTAQEMMLPSNPKEYVENVKKAWEGQSVLPSPQRLKRLGRIQDNVDE